MKLETKLPSTAADDDDLDDDDESKNPSSAQIVDSITDLLTEIFLRLPLKPLFQFKCVSKNWKSIISSPRFHLMHPLIPDLVTTGLIFHNNCSRSLPYIVPLDDPPTAPPPRNVEFIAGLPQPHSMKVYSSCNGLLICGVKEFDYSLWGYYVCNPTTKSYRRLPDLEGGSWIRGIYLAFDPLKSTHYKVVCVRRIGMLDGDTSSPSSSSTFEVYSSKTRSWRKVGDRPFTTKVDLKDGVYWNGSIHWLSVDKTGDSVYFDLEGDHDRVVTKVMLVLPIPDTFCLLHRHYFGVSRGHLHYVDMRLDFGQNHEFDVYEMRRDYSEWFLKYSVVDIPEVVIHRNSFAFISIHALVRGEKDEDSVMVFAIGKRKMMRYNFALGTFENFGDVTNDLVHRSDQGLAFPYIESLSCV